MLPLPQFLLPLGALPHCFLSGFGVLPRIIRHRASFKPMWARFAFPRNKLGVTVGARVPFPGCPVSACPRVRPSRVGYPGVRHNSRSTTAQTSGLIERMGQQTANHCAFPVSMSQQTAGSLTPESIVIMAMLITAAMLYIAAMLTGLCYAIASLRRRAERHFHAR